MRLVAAVQAVTRSVTARGKREGAGVLRRREKRVEMKQIFREFGNNPRSKFHLVPKMKKSERKAIRRGAG